MLFSEAKLSMAQLHKTRNPAPFFERQSLVKVEALVHNPQKSGETNDQATLREGTR